VKHKGLALQIRAISIQRLMICLGEIQDANLRFQINNALRVHLNL